MVCVYTIHGYLRLNDCIDYSGWLLPTKLFWFGNRRPCANVRPRARGRNCIADRCGMEKLLPFLDFLVLSCHCIV